MKGAAAVEDNNINTANRTKVPRIGSSHHFLLRRRKYSSSLGRLALPCRAAFFRSSMNTSGTRIDENSWRRLAPAASLSSMWSTVDVFEAPARLGRERERKFRLA